MSVFLPCLFLVALGLCFGAVHMLAYKSAEKDGTPGEKPSIPFGCGGHCGACGLTGCGNRAAAGGEAGQIDGKPDR